ncbi:MAG: hypothetical protein ACREQQ_11470, partial [Candidatus Binatia bacterium]
LEALEREAGREARVGRRLVGAYEEAFTNDRAYAIWAHRTLGDLAAYEESRRRHLKDRRRDLEGWSEHWGFAAPGSPLWPKDYPTDVRIW